MEAVERSEVDSSPTAGDAAQGFQDETSPDGIAAASDKGPDAAETSDAVTSSVHDQEDKRPADATTQAVCRRYSRDSLLAFRQASQCQRPPDDWDLNHMSELLYPAPPGRAPEQAANDLQHQDIRRGMHWGHGSQLPGPRNEGPIRSRLVENGGLTDGPMAHQPPGRQGSGPGARAWNLQKDDAEQDIGPGPPGYPRGRGMGRKESGQPERWNSSQAPGGDSWRGLSGQQGRGQGPDPRERQWGTHPQQPPPPARPVEVPRAASQPLDRDTHQGARSLEKDWRAGKGKGPPPSPSSREWSDSYHHQHTDCHMQSAASGDQPERHKHDRQKAGGRGNPEWMGEDSDAVAADANGASAGARRAQQFEAERQRMKEEWKKQQAQLKGAATQPVTMAEFMTDDDLEALKAETNAEAADDKQAGISANGMPQQHTGSSGQQSGDSSLLTRFFGQAAPGSAAAPKSDNNFDFRSLAQAAGQSLPAMPPMPKGVTTLQDLERYARLSGQAPPPGFTNVIPLATAQADFGRAHLPSGQDTASSTVNAGIPTPAQPASLSQRGPDMLAYQPTAAQDSGKALLGLLSNAAAAAQPADETAEQSRPTAVTPPPGFPPINRAQVPKCRAISPVSAAQAAASSSQPAPVAQSQTPISWDTSQLQGIWGAPAPSTGGSQPLWGAPLSLTPHASSSGALQTPFALEQPTSRPAEQPQDLPSPFMQAGRTAFGGQSDQPATARSDEVNASGLFSLDRRTSSAAAQPEPNAQREQMGSQASNPLLALLGQHRSPNAEGSRASHDPQLQAFLQAQSGHYSWHPQQAAHKPQIYSQQVQQQQQQQLPQPAVHHTNESLSHDLLQRLQLGQSRLQQSQTQAQANPLQLPHAGLSAYQHTAPAYMQQPRPSAAYGLQAGLQYGQQHQVPQYLGNALPRQAYGQLPGQALGNQYVQQQHQHPGQTYSHPLAGMQSNAHLAQLDAQRYGNYPAVGGQAYSNNDLSQLLLQRLQQQQQQHQQAFNQSAQRGTGLDRFFNPAAFSSVQNPRVPTAQASVSELEAMMARQ